MASSTAERAAPRDSVCGPQGITKLGGSWCPDAANPEPKQGDLAWTPADFRVANRGLDDLELALLDCLPVGSGAQVHAQLWSLGVRLTAGLHFDMVVLLPGGQFEFARNLRDASGSALGLVIPAYDDMGNLDDLVALNLGSGSLGRWRGRAAMLGAENVYGPRLGEPLAMHETALEWLKADRDGVFVLDPQRASRLLRMVEPLGVKRAAFGRRMREAMTIRPPRILVAENGTAA